MQYAIIDSEHSLHALLDIPEGQRATWGGPEDFEAIIGEFPEIEIGADYSEYT